MIGNVDSVLDHWMWFHGGGKSYLIMSIHSQMPAVGDLIADKYLVEYQIGSGGMGSVYAARHRATRRLFALKCMSSELSGDAEATQRFVREAKLAGSIDHPGIIEIYDIGQHNGSLYIVMDLLEGESLNERLRRGPIPYPEAAEIMIGILGGIGAAHARGIIHRDLKPDNIFLCRSSNSPHGSPEPRILDFGVSKALNKDGASIHALTQTGVMVGTPLYMSPEQVQGSKDVDHRTDIYALGVMLYEMLSGQVPYMGNNLAALIFAILSGQAKPLIHLVPGIPHELSDLVMRAMSISKDNRFFDTTSFAGALKPFVPQVRSIPPQYMSAPPVAQRGIPSAAHRTDRLDISTPFSRQIPSPTEDTLPVRKVPWALVVGAIALVVVGSATFYALGGPEKKETSQKIEASPVNTATLPPDIPSEVDSIDKPTSDAGQDGKSRSQTQTAQEMPQGVESPGTDLPDLNGDSDKERERHSSRKSKMKGIKQEEKAVPEETTKKPPPKEPSDYEISEEGIIDPFGK